MQSMEPVSILLPIHVSFLLEELLHFLLVHLLGLLPFPLSTDLGLAHLGFGSASPWGEALYVSYPFGELFHLPLGHSSNLLHSPLT